MGEWNPHFRWDVQDALVTRADLDGRNQAETSGSIIAHMPLLWIVVPNVAMRSRIEENSIKLLSNFRREQIDPPSPQWLGHFGPKEAIARSGLWNDKLVRAHLRGSLHDPAFIDHLNRLIDAL